MAEVLSIFSLKVDDVFPDGEQFDLRKWAKRSDVGMASNIKVNACLSPCSEPGVNVGLEWSGQKWIAETHSPLSPVSHDHLWSDFMHNLHRKNGILNINYINLTLHLVQAEISHES